MAVEDVFDRTDRGVGIIGVHTGGVIRSGDGAVLRFNGDDVRVPEVVVEIHHPPEKIALVLRSSEVCGATVCYVRPVVPTSG